MAWAAMLALATSTPAFAQADEERAAEAAKVAGCAIDKTFRHAVGLGRWPDSSDSDVYVVATLSNVVGDNQLGDLCVALVREESNRFTKLVARSVGRLQPQTDGSPTTFASVEIDDATYQISPTESAVSVIVQGGVNTQSVGVGTTTQYLFRRQGERLVPVFSDVIGFWDEDKIGNHSNEALFTVSLSPKLTGGMHDLIVKPKRGRGVRYTWDGARYREAKR